jgi:predicted transcriptional regulator
MKKESVSYEIMIDLIANIVKTYIDSNSISTNETNNANKKGEVECMH